MSGPWNRRVFVKLWSQFFCVFICCFLAVTTYSLPAEVELDRFIIAAKKHIDGADFVAAESYLLRAKELNIELPAEFYYSYGQVLQHKGEPLAARQNLERYIEKAGKEGEFYSKALESINSIEELGVRPVAEPSANLDWSKAADTMKKENGYLREMRELYLTDNDLEALELHINSLLSVYHIGNGPNLKNSTPLQYVTSISVGNGVIISSIKSKESADGEVRTISNKFSVFGVNPYIKYDCSEEELSCWITHPQDGTQWIRLVHDSDVAKELNKALTHLIKEMQKG